MRIAFITSQFPTETLFDGGLSSYVARKAIALLALGHEPVVLVSSKRRESIRFKGVQVERVPVSNPPAWFGKSATTFWFWYRNSAATSRVLYELHREKPFDVIQSPNIVPQFHRLPRGPLHVHRLSSYVPLWRKGLEQPTRAAEFLFDCLEHFTAKGADGVFAPSRIVAEEVGRRTGRSVEVIESPFADLAGEQDASEYQSKLAGKRYLLFFGTLNPLKGMVELLAVIRNFLDQQPDLHFVLVGRDDGYRGRSFMARLRSEAGPHQGRLIHIHRMPHAKLMPIIQGSLAVVLPSRIDNIPNTCLEAFSCAKMVLGSDGASFEQLITEGHNGILCKPYDAQSLLAALEKTMRLSDEERDQMGQNAKARLEQLRPQVIAERWLKFCSKIKTGA